MNKQETNLIKKVYEEEVFVTDGFAAYRTEPPKVKGNPYRLFCKTQDGEVELDANASNFLKIIIGEEVQEEISHEKYYGFVHPSGIF